MAKKVKLDTTKLKQFVLEKGERVGLAVAVVVMILFLGYGLLTGLSASSPADTIKKATSDLSSRIDSSKPPPEEPPAKDAKPPGVWDKRERYELFASTGGWFDPGAAGNSKKQNPDVLPVGDVVAGGQVKNIQVNYIVGGVLTLDYDAKSESLATLKASGAAGPGLPGSAPAAAPAVGADDSFTRLLHPTRMIVVTATFPYREQLDVTRKALRMASTDELLASPQSPRFLGLIVYRWEIMPDGKATDQKAVYESDTDNKGRTIVPMPETNTLLTTAEYDKAITAQVAEYLRTGLVTPLPRFMNARYPKLALAGIDVKGADDDEADKTDPAKPGPGGPRQQLPGGPIRIPGGPGRMIGGAAGNDTGPTMTSGKAKRLSDLTDKKLVDQLKGEFNFFDAYGGPLPDETDANIATPMAQALPPPLAGKASGDSKGPEKILVRFFDADVQPGKTYMYSIQVRMANPNFGKKDVAYPSLAEIKELVSPPIHTPAITLGTEYFVYAVDVSPKQLESKAKGTEKEPVSAERTAIQIQRWADIVRDGAHQYVVADWVIAERLLVHRGEVLARAEVEVELPIWNKYGGPGGKFELASSGGSSRGKAGKNFRQTASVDFGFPRDFAHTSVLVDFEGGKRPYETAAGRVQDDASEELLVLRPDGKLVVRTGREDTDPESETGTERMRRYQAWHKRISPLRSSNGPGGGPGFNAPGR